MPDIPPNEVTRIRELLNLTREELAKELDVSHWTVQSWERGQRACTGPAAILLLQILDNSPTEKPDATSQTTDQGATPGGDGTA